MPTKFYEKGMGLIHFRPVIFTDWDEATQTAATIRIGDHMAIDSRDTWELWNPETPDEFTTRVHLMGNQIYTPTKGGHTSRYQLLVKYPNGRTEYVTPERKLQFKNSGVTNWSDNPLAEERKDTLRRSAGALDNMRKALETFASRTGVYKDSHYLHGRVLAAMFPNEVVLATAQDHTRWVTFNQIMGKLCRYAVNWGNGGHADSMHDVGVYAFILEAIDGQTPPP